MLKNILNPLYHDCLWISVTPILDNFISDKQMSIAIDFSYNNYNLDENYSLTMYFTLLTTHIKFNVYWKIIFFAL